MDLPVFLEAKIRKYIGYFVLFQISGNKGMCVFVCVILLHITQSLAVSVCLPYFRLPQSLNPVGPRPAAVLLLQNHMRKEVTVK